MCPALFAVSEQTNLSSTNNSILDKVCNIDLWNFIKFQVLRKFTENSSSACYQAASAGKWQAETIANYSGEHQVRKRFDKSTCQNSLGPISFSKQA